MLSQRALAIMVVAALVCAIVLAHDLTTTPTYQARSQLLIGSLTAELSQIVDPSSRNGIDPNRERATALVLANSPGVAARARKDLGLSETTAELQDEVVASAEPGADLITLTVDDRDPERAARIANGFADAFVAMRKEANRSRAKQAVVLLQRQIDQLPRGSARREQLQVVLDRVRTLNVVESGEAEVVDRAGVPTSPESPKKVRDAILGLLVGLVAGVMTAFALDAFDRRVRGPRELETLTGLPVLAVIAHQSLEPRSQEQRQAALEPYRILHAALPFLGGGGAIRVLAVTSARSGDGRTSVAAGLARACALAGESVVLVEADMRRPSFERRFDLGKDVPGLDQALAAGDLDSLLRPILPGLNALRALPVGGLPESPADVLGSAALDRVLSELAAGNTRVIIDGPPLLAFAEGQALLSQPSLDACLVVGRLGRIKREDATGLRLALEHHRLLNAGLVINDARKADLNDWDSAGRQPAAA